MRRRRPRRVEPYGTNDYGGFRNILPPGENGLDDLTQAAAFRATGAYPPHANDQLGMYSSLTTAAPITEAQIPQFFKDATFGVPAGDVASTESPEPGATIERDAQFGVPHIYGDTRAELMFGIGYASAEDRLFMMDVLRHAGEADLAQFAGGSNVAMDEQVWENEPYTQQDLVNQVNWLPNLPDGSQVLSDAENYVDGVNAYISAAESPLNTLTMMPAEYAAIGQPTGPQPFTVEDIVKVATLVGGIFGEGGGQQLSNAVLYENLRARFGSERRDVAGSPELLSQPAAKKQKPKKGKPKAKKASDVLGLASLGVPGAVAPGIRARRGAPAGRATKRAGKAGLGAGKLVSPDKSGFATFMSFDDPSDPEAPTTAHGHSFPYQTLPMPTKATLKTMALPDPGSVQYANPVVAGSVPGGAAADARTRSSASGAAAVSGLLGFPRSMSNALLVSAADSASGHALAVMGPQVSYYSPQILMEQDEHGPGIDAEGAAFPGTNLYVELGHGQDYAWSATSAGQNIIDTFAAPLCNPSGGAVSMSSDYYLLNGKCVQMETLTRSESWQPNLGDSTPAGSVTFQTQRTAYGIVTARARIKGQPVVYTNLRSTYMHELDSAVGFEQFNEPAEMRNPQDFMNAAYHIGYTFNWFYVDDKNVAYFNSGQNAVRAAHTDPLFPSWASDAWQGLHAAAQMTPTSLTEQQTPQSAHPQTVNLGYITSWNNKQAPGYNDAATGQEYASIYRSQLLDNNLNAQLSQAGGKLTLADVINAMANAGTQDLRGVEVLPYALQIIGHPTNPTLANAVNELSAWVASGAHRINRAHPGASGDYDQSDAIRIMDAWWPLLVQAEFGPTLGSSLLGQVEADFPIDDAPGHGVSGEHLGSAYDVGFYGIVQKDLRSLLGDRETGPLNRIYCGGGSLTRCRSAFEASLTQAAAESPDQVYPGDSVCSAGDQMCSDSIEFKPIGVITQPLMEWINRPTFQQADEILGHGPR